MNRHQQSEIRKKLALRRNPQNLWEVYTTIHGTGKFKWFIITDSMADWYKRSFPMIDILTYNELENPK